MRFKVIMLALYQLDVHSLKTNINTVWVRVIFVGFFCVVYRCCRIKFVSSSLLFAFSLTDTNLPNKNGKLTESENVATEKWLYYYASVHNTKRMRPSSWLVGAWEDDFIQRMNKNWCRKFTIRKQALQAKWCYTIERTMHTNQPMNTVCAQ